jgi:transposase
VGEAALCESAAPKEAVGLDLGLRETLATSDGDKLEAGHFYRNIEQKIAGAQRRGHERQAKRYTGPPQGGEKTPYTSSQEGL